MTCGGERLPIRGVAIGGVQLREVLIFVAECILVVHGPLYSVDKRDAGVLN
jgi:hypothetical protein